MKYEPGNLVTGITKILEPGRRHRTTLLAKSTIRPEDARNPVGHLGSEWGFPPSIAVQTTASEFANSA